MSRNIKACLTSNTDDWKTPKIIYDAFMNKGYIDCFKYQDTENQFTKTYYQKKLFINPPFSKMKKVIEWVEEQSKQENHIFLLIPARTDTKYFHKLLELQPIIYFIKGRLHYNDSKSAPFPTLLIEIHAFYGYNEYKEIKQNEICNII